MKLLFSAFWLLVCAILFGNVQINAADEKPVRPNIVIFLIDDLGRCDIGVDGAKFYETPHLDACARSGVRMTDFYSACPVCSPTRAALMTGKAPQRLGITDWIKPSSGIVLPAKETTLGEAFQQQGYRTGYVGKWHLGEDDASLPLQHGFGWMQGVNRGGQPGSYHFPFKRPGNQPSVLDVPDFENANPTDYLTDVLTSGAIEFLKQQKAGQPFLLCCGHYAIHTPIQPPAQLPEKYRDKRSKLYGDSATPTQPAANNAITRIRQDDADYAAMMENLDTNFGRVLTALDEIGQRANTIVLFTSDNGGLSTLNGKPGPTCNLPFRNGKGWTYEGGIRIPTFVSWPEKLPPGVCQVPGTTADIYPTLLELCGLPLQPQQHLDGKSLVACLHGQQDNNVNDRTLGWYYPHDHNSGHRPSAAIRRGAWKLIYFLQSKQFELYHLGDDPGELHDLATVQPERATNMRDELLKWIAETTKS